MLLLLTAPPLASAQDPSADSLLKPSVEGAVAKPQGTSLLGVPLIPPLPSEEVLENLRSAQSDLAADPGDADALIWVGRRYAYAGQYRKAISVFTRGIEQHPDDARMYRHRGHRFITLRAFQEAVADLETAARLMSGTPDQVEPDGLPNALGIPVSSLHTNVWYHLGLAYYLQHDWPNALRAYQAGFEAARNDDNRVSTAYWRYMILRRMHREDEALAVLEGISPGMEIIENHVYHRLCLFFKGALGEHEVLPERAANASDAAAAYGLANWHLFNGDPSKAMQRFNALLATDQWAAFGFIAAEAEVAARQ